MASGQRSGIERRLLEASCLEIGVDLTLVEALIDLERENERRLRRRGIFPAMRTILEEHASQVENDFQAS